MSGMELYAIGVTIIAVTHIIVEWRDTLRKEQTIKEIKEGREQ